LIGNALHHVIIILPFAGQSKACPARLPPPSQNAVCLKHQALDICSSTACWTVKTFDRFIGETAIVATQEGQPVTRSLPVIASLVPPHTFSITILKLNFCQDFSVTDFGAISTSLVYHLTGHDIRLFLEFHVPESHLPHLRELYLKGINLERSALSVVATLTIVVYSCSYV
jgi:hypothetical protein